MKIAKRITLFLISFSLMAPIALKAELPSEIDFNRDVRPILSDKCFHCHGPDPKTREAKLRLDIREEAIKERKGIRSIVPGKADESEIINRILSKDADDVMPPPEIHKSVSKQEVEVLKKWINNGAEYKDFWFYLPPKKATLPKVEGKTYNAIDHFVQARLKEKNLKPSPEADPVTLVRRVYFDIIGLPPSPKEVEAYIKDKNPNKWENLVDSLLAKKSYGERMAIMWLDLVRYADTVGYHGDQPVSQSPYRDYIIHAFNKNMPYDQFTREQLAGDLLENPSQDQKIASAYNRLNMTTEEGGSQAKEYLAKYASDRVRNVSAIWMGSTVGCSECHDHKFDPFTTKDFYSMASFFADLQEVGVYGARKRPPQMKVLTGKNKEQVTKLEKEKESLIQKKKEFKPEHQSLYTSWVQKQKKAITNSTFESKDDVWVDDEPLRKAKKEGKWRFVNAKKGKVNSGQKARLQEGNGTIQHFFTVKQKYKAKKGEVFFFNVWLEPKKMPKTIMLQVNNGTWEHRAFWGEDKIEFGGIGKNTPAHRKKGKLPEGGKWHRITVKADEIGIKPGDQIQGLAFTQFGGKAYWDQAGISIDSRLPKNIETLVKKESLLPNEEKPLKDYFLAYSNIWKKENDRINAIEKEISNIDKGAVTVPISVTVKPRMMRVLNRGDWMDESGEVVSPAIPAFMGKLDLKGRRANRLDLANWFLQKDNPLTARVFMNNLWALYFGTAISKIQDDLGGQGEWPSHLALLDWLAVEFQESKWDIKHMVKLIVTSHTYKQQSTDTPNLREVDPYNRLLARQSRYPLQAELIRDNALKISGLLVDKLGGVSAKPYQPAGYYRQLNFPRRTYKADTNENQYRRGVYTWWQRTFLHPTMKAFNAPDREACTSSRPQSNTPLQALSLMNDPSFVEAARALAARAIEKGGPTIKEQIAWAYKQTLSQAPDQTVLAILYDIHQKHTQEYAKDPKLAAEILKVGMSKAGTNLNASQLAAMQSVTRVILNLSQTITRN